MDPYPFLRPLLFQLSAERAHQLTIKLIKIGMLLPGFHAFTASKAQHPSHQCTLAGLHFTNRLGLAAGLDKNAEIFNEMLAIGFGSVEVGTVTPRPQHGNPRPRVFRLPKDKALINRLGFNNDGADRIAKRLSKRTQQGIVGGNIGKNKDTPNDQAPADYAEAFRKLAPYVDYFTINISSPNTPDLRALQHRGLQNILDAVQSENEDLRSKRPIFLKIAPDLSGEQIDQILHISHEGGIDGFITTNTTTERTNLSASQAELDEIGHGGLSGRPLTTKATNILAYLKQHDPKALPLIASGGIMDADDAMEKFEAGASLVQLYTGFVYKGPALLDDILKRLRNATDPEAV
jgi:dihydroorotate dehydrogenase